MTDDEDMTLEPTGGWIEHPAEIPALEVGMRVQTPYGGEATIWAHWPEDGAYGVWGVRYDDGVLGAYSPSDLTPTQSPIDAMKAVLAKRAARRTMEDFYPEHPPIAVHPSHWDDAS